MNTDLVHNSRKRGHWMDVCLRQWWHVWAPRTSTAQ